MKNCITKSISMTLIILLSVSIPMKAEEPTEPENTSTHTTEIENNEEILTPLLESELPSNLKIDESDTAIESESDTDVLRERDTRATLITTEAQLQSAINQGIGEVALVIQGGTEITLTQPLSINTDKLTKVSFTSSNAQNVNIKNNTNEKHIMVSGNNAISLVFSHITLIGGNDRVNGGISISNNAVGHEIKGVTIKENNISGNDGASIYFKSNSGSLSISNATFIANTVSSWTSNNSSIIFADITDARIALDNLTFHDTILSNQSGAVINIKNSNSVAEITNLLIKNTQSKGASAGLKYSGTNNATLKLSESEFSGNSNTVGNSGGMLLNQSDKSNVIIKNTRFENNYGHRGGGGLDVSVRDIGSYLELDGVEFNNNTASMIKYDSESGLQTGVPSTGGGLNFFQATGTSEFVIKNSSFTNNIASTGGGLNLYIYNRSRAITTIENTLFDNNEADLAGGAILINFVESNSQDHLFTIKNSQITNNIATGRQSGDEEFDGGEGGGINFYNILVSPNALELEGVTFANNTSNFPMIWNYQATNQNAMNTQYREKIRNTTFTQGSSDLVESYNNAFNGDDIGLDYDAIAYFVMNSDNIEDLNLQNYQENGHYYYFSVLDQTILPIIEPVSSTHTFLGWYDQNDVKWDFETEDLTEVYTYLYAKWSVKQAYTVVYNLNGGQGLTPESQTILEGNLILQPIAPVREGFIFVGWSTQQENADKLWDFNSDKMPSNNLELFAQWKIKDEEITEPEVIVPEIKDPEVTKPELNKPTTESETAQNNVTLPNTGYKNDFIMLSSALILIGLTLIVLNNKIKD